MPTLEVPPPKTLARLQELRLERNWTYKELAQEIGITTSTLYRFMKRRNAGTTDRTAFRIKRFLSRTSRVA